MFDELPKWAVEFVVSARVARLATASISADPHVVAACFAFDGGRIYVPIDEKPKSGVTLTRVRNIRASPKAALIVDHYDENWTQLAWVQARGAARMLGPAADQHAGAIAALRDKYPQYRLMTLETSDLIEIVVERWRWWRWEND